MSDLLPDSNSTFSLDAIKRIDVICVRFENAWKDGQQPGLEEYLSLVEPNEQNKLKAELLKIEQHYRSGDELPESPPAKSLESIGRYHVERVLGKGRFGIVYLAYDEKLERRVAVKTPHPELVSGLDAAKEYLAEARTVANLDHPNIVPVFDVGSTGEFPCYIVSKFIEGETLAQRIRDCRPGFGEAAEIVSTIAQTLHYAHGEGIFHRDIKPSNILLDTRGKVFVADFGLALLEKDVGKGPKYVGTPSYMSPEQARGEGHLVDARTDVYSLGVVLYVLLTGQKPLPSHDDKIKVLEFVKWREPKPPRQIDDSIPRELDRICLKAMSKRASDRHSTASDLAEDLRQWLASQPDLPKKPFPVPAEAAAPGSSTSDLPKDTIVPKGLRSFDAEDAHFYLELLPGPRGRSGLPESIRFWKAMLEEMDPDRTFRVGLIYGPSGCGKSSLVKAGLLPRLSGEVTAVYLQASADDTETTLLKLLRKQWPDLPEDLGPAKTLAYVRRWQSETKLVMIFDQFEQWLHAHSGDAGIELIEALRQCDGKRVQALLLVRDDFWMGISRFLWELEVPLREGQNSAKVDLFDARHARKVLAAFGRAFGALPEGELESEQKRFLNEAVSGLSEDGKVVPVRLALFAEMVKGKPWTLETWSSIGGAEGVGVAFLEETFSATTAAPQHKVHQKAARAVLKLLLPDHGSDLKGPMRSRQELLAASGYGQQIPLFDDLLRILDEELRLVTATELEVLETAESKDSHTGTSYYQLTHDYLVPALRQWLGHKQKETMRGRAEIRLAERAAMWAIKQEDRHLPSWLEFGQIRLLTRKSDWTTAQKKMMRKASWHYAVRGVALAIVLILAAWGGREFLGWFQSRELSRRLLSAETKKVPSIVEEMGSYRRWVDPMLRRHFAAAKVSNDAKKMLHLRLALLPADPSQAEHVYARMLEAEAVEFDAICQALAPHKDLFVKRLWATLADKNSNLAQRFRAACALAKYDPNNKRWRAHSALAARQLVSENSLVLDEWKNALQPIGRKHLLKPLADLLEDEGSEAGERRTIASLYKAYAAGREQTFVTLEKQMKKVRQRALNAPDKLKAKIAKRAANIAAALAAMGRGMSVLPLLKHSPDPTVRSYLIERLGPGGVDPQMIEYWIADPDREISVRRALILALGWFDPERVPTAPQKLIWMYENETDPGIHGAAGWVLRHWGMKEELTRIDQRLATGRPEANREWFVNKEGQTYVIIPKPGEVWIGTGKDRKKHNIDYSYAMAATEVTVDEFRRWKKDHQYDAETAPSGDCPVNRVTWHEAAAYCNWLSRQDGFGDKDLCYLPREQQNGVLTMSIANDYLQRKGYRLPTDAEWEFAARAGAATNHFCGEADEGLLGKYACFDHYFNLIGVRCMPVSSLKPNDLGFFDIFGNVHEWCQHYSAAQNDAVIDRSVVRGGSISQRIRFVDFDVRIPHLKFKLSKDIGLRPLRAIP